MDGFEEKKWFVYLGDHHEGPFSLKDIEQKLGQAQVTGSSYIWSDGMADWALMKEIAVFEPLLSRGNPSNGPRKELELELQDEDDLSISLIREKPKTPFLSADVLKLDRAAEPMPVNRRSTAAPTAAATRPSSPSSPSSMRAGSVKRAAKAGLVIGIIGGGFYAYRSGALDPALESPAVRSTVLEVSGWINPAIIRYSKSFPVILDVLSPLPSVNDVDHEELRELKVAALALLSDPSTATLAVALSQSEPTRPVFYVASNLPDGTSFDVQVDGVPDTLINRYKASVKGSALLHDRIAKTIPLTLDGNQPLPVGEYEVTVNRTGEKTPWIHKLIFIGGKKDAAYEARLREFHVRTTERAGLELSELKQLMSVAETNLALTQKRFEESRKGTAARKRVWPRFHSTEWVSAMKPMTDAFAKWNADGAKGEIYYEELYRQMQQMGDLLTRLNQVQDDFLTGKGERNSIDIQLGEANSVAQSTILTLKLKIEVADKAASASAAAGPAGPSEALPKQEEL